MCIASVKLHWKIAQRHTHAALHSGRRAIDKDRTMSGLERIASIHRDSLPTTLHAHACFSTLTQFSFTLVVVGDVRFSIFFVFSFHSVVYLLKAKARFSSTMAKSEDRAHESIFNLLLLL